MAISGFGNNNNWNNYNKNNINKNMIVKNSVKTNNVPVAKTPTTVQSNKVNVVEVDTNILNAAIVANSGINVGAKISLSGSKPTWDECWQQSLNNRYGRACHTDQQLTEAVMCDDPEDLGSALPWLYIETALRYLWTRMR